MFSLFLWLAVVSDSEVNGPLSDTEQGGERTAFRYPAVSTSHTEEKSAATNAQSADEPRTPQVIPSYNFDAFS